MERAKTRKLRRERRKKVKMIPIPTSVLRTEEDEKMISKIKKDTMDRQKIFESKQADQEVEDPLPSMNKFDLVLEFVDSRDPIGSSSSKLFELVKSAGKPYIKIYYNEGLIPAGVLSAWQQRETPILSREIHRVRDIIQSLNKTEEIKVLIAANKDFNEINFIDSEIFGGIKFFRIFTECEENVGGILRDVCKLNYLNFESLLWTVIQKLNKDELILKYRVPDFDTCKDFVISIAKNYNILDERNKIDYLKSSNWFLDNIKKDYRFFIDPNNNFNLEIMKSNSSA